MTSVASPTIIFNGKPEQGYINHLIDPFLEHMYGIRLRNYERVVLYRKPNDEGVFTFRSINNKLHRACAGHGYYLTTPVIVNYNKALTKEQVDEFIDTISMCDKGRIYYVEMDEYGEYTVDLLVARKVTYMSREDILQDRFNVRTGE